MRKKAKKKAKKMFSGKEGFEGFGIGDKVVRLYVSTDEAVKLVPDKIEGVPVLIVRTGKIKALGKKKKLADMSHLELVSEYTTTVRKSWDERGSYKNPGHNPLYQRELSIKRELLRRLTLK